MATERARPRWARAWLAAAALFAVCAALGSQEPAGTPPARPELPDDGSSGCLECHTGIEPMHPEAALSCVDCHGGNARSRSKSEAHVRATRAPARDERVAALDDDLPWRRFLNPMDLRVAEGVCGGCHEGVVEHLRASLHGTTAGHLSDGYYEAGLLAKKESPFAVFATQAPRGSESPLERLSQVPAFEPGARQPGIAAHYGDLARKECMQCHLWSEGRAVRGRVGFDGDYRGQGCAACHVEYALDGLSESADRQALHGEPGHPRRHSMTGAPTTQACTACHYGDAAIGLNFRGLSQLPPGALGGPEIKGTTDRLLNRQFYLRDESITPPDVHHERGMHCIDCHTADDVMGDGRLVGAMEQAVEISCSDCHGTFTARATLRTQRGTRLEHLRQEGSRVLLKSKVDGREHEVVQVVDVLDPAHPRHNPRAAKAMTAAHGKVECYTCHAAWNPNFLGFHFDRNESLSQLDLLSGRRTEGRVTTQEKVFATWKSFYAGFNEHGAVAPYLTGFSTMGSVTDARGERVLDQVMPVTQAGLSGVTMIHHQMHTVRKSARSCVECHRSSATWGLGSPNFQLARQLAFFADRRGIEAVALDRTRLAGSPALGKVVQPDVTALELDCEPLQGHARTLYAAEGARGIHVFDVRDPREIKRLAFHAAIEPHDLAVRGDFLYAAEGSGGLAIYDVREPARIRRVARVPMCDARALAVQWPYVYVADGPAGLAIVDVRAPIAPQLVSSFAPESERGPLRSAIDVALLFQYSQPVARKEAGQERPGDTRSDARLLCVVLDEERGYVALDVTEPTEPRQLYPDPRRKPGPTTAVDQNLRFRSMVLLSHVDLSQPQGGARTVERDYLYLLSERDENGMQVSFLTTLDLSLPARPKRIGALELGGSTETLVPLRLYNPPFLQSVLLATGAEGLLAADVTVSAQPAALGTFASLRQGYAVAVENFAFDRMLDEAGRPHKDVSHARSRWAYLNEIERILSVPAAALGRPKREAVAPTTSTWTARLSFTREDADGSAFLEGAELARGVLEHADRDGDERVSLAEYCARAGLLPETVAFRAPVVSSSGRTGRDGDLARLFDGVDPAALDRDGDGALTRPDVERALFLALDLDRDGRLTRDEAARAPGALRGLRFGGARADALFEARDQDRNGFLDPRDLRLRDEDWTALDLDSDGEVSLRRLRGSRPALRGRGMDGVEWPYRQLFLAHLPPDATRERVLAFFDEDRDGTLNKRELTRRPELVTLWDEDQDGVIRANEIDLRVGALGDYGVDASPDAFRARWDLDGDGAVTERELTLPAWMRERLLERR